MRDSDDKLTRKRLQGRVLVSVGLCTVAIGLMWKQLVPAETYWTEQQAAEYNAAYSEAHSLSIGHQHSPGEPHNHSHDRNNTDALEAARERLSLAEQKLNQSRALQSFGGPVLSILGLVLAVSGVWVLRQADS